MFRNHLSQFALPIIVVLSTHTHTANAVTTEIILPESSLGEQCTDTAPFDDDWGWNGTCTCSISASQADTDGYDMFGFYMAASDSALTVSSAETPNGCVDSGSATVFTITENGTVEQESEVVSSLRAITDEFSTNSNGSLLAISDSHMVVRFSDKKYVNRVSRGKVVAVFKKEEGNWIEDYILQDDINEYSRFSFGENLQLVGDEILMEAQGGIHRYRISDGTLLQTIERPEGRCSLYHTTYENMLFLRWPACDNTASDVNIHLYELADSGQYEEVLTDIIINGPSDTFTSPPLLNNNLLVVDGNPIDENLRTTTYTKGTNGWARTVIQPTLDRRQHLINSQLVVRDYNELQFYSFDAVNGWTPSQQITIPPIMVDSENETIYTDTSMVAVENRITFIESEPRYLFSQYTALEERDVRTAYTPMITALEPDENGQWQIVYSEQFPGGGNQPIANLYATSGNTFVTLGNGGVLNVIFDQGTTPNDTSDSDSVSTQPSECDYTSAALYDGWGWNPITRTSCPPLPKDEITNSVINTTIPTCSLQSSDTDNDGWGWENNASCRVTETAPDTQTSVPTCQSAASDQSGDGWGWESNASCRVTETTPATQTSVPACQSALSDQSGDGWGWENNQSCRVSG